MAAVVGAAVDAWVVVAVDVPRWDAPVVVAGAERICRVPRLALRRPARDLRSPAHIPAVQPVALVLAQVRAHDRVVVPLRDVQALVGRGPVLEPPDLLLAVRWGELAVRVLLTITARVFRTCRDPVRVAQGLVPAKSAAELVALGREVVLVPRRSRVKSPAAVAVPVVEVSLAAVVVVLVAVVTDLAVAVDVLVAAVTGLAVVAIAPVAAVIGLAVVAIAPVAAATGPAVVAIDPVAAAIDLAVAVVVPAAVEITDPAVVETGAPGLAAAVKTAIGPTAAIAPMAATGR